MSEVNEVNVRCTDSVEEQGEERSNAGPAEDSTIRDFHITPGAFSGRSCDAG